MQRARCFQKAICNKSHLEVHRDRFAMFFCFLKKKNVIFYTMDPVIGERKNYIEFHAEF